MRGLIINKNDQLYVKYVQQHDGYTINVHEIEIHPQNKNLQLIEGQVVEFEMLYNQKPTKKNYAKIKT